MKITRKEQRMKRERKTKKSYSIAKKNLVRGHSMTFAKKSEIRTPLPYSIHKHPILV